MTEPTETLGQLLILTFFATDQQPSEACSSGPRHVPRRHEFQLVVEHRPVLDQLIHPHRQSPHEHAYCRTLQVSTAESHK
ncbi:hypothetical protein E0500_042265 [Streptomyces sp. KM273126]|uniref:hypothetical protein n=1 Tax=Streptomyces sp. KM273126 TaxID=2545247 RepID=UPI00103CE165|nr:hypothetical protein [Streptomyces sp. KM273126]MBA2813765.1 hypothetical protein [Streptomyces sp. KM273126]